MWNDESSVSLGIPASKATDASDSDPYQSFIGGSPALFQDAQMAASRCRLCSGPVQFVAQIYAPIDYLHRTLYFYACPQRQCCLNNEGWTVIRQQQLEAAQSVAAPLTAATSASDTLLGGAGMSSWLDDDDDDENTSMADLEKMLETRDKTLFSAAESTAAAAAAAVNQKKKVSGTGPVAAKGTATCWVLETTWEPDATHSEQDHGISEDKIKGMLTNYVADEEDSVLLETLRKYTDKKASPGGETRDEDEEEEEEEEDLDKEEGSIIASVLGKGKSNGSTSAAGSAAPPAPRLPLLRAGNVERRFAQRVARAPTQAMRYCYGGQPLWCQAPSPALIAYTKKPPRCENCGAARAFELQLMPALLSFMHRMGDGKTGGAGTNNIDVERDIGTAVAVDDGGSGSGSGVKTSQHGSSSVVQASAEQIAGFMADVQAAGVDFGVLAVWSCERSCTPRGTSAVEVAVVQPPSDF